MIAIFEVTKPDRTKHLVIVEGLTSPEQVTQVNDNLMRDYPRTKMSGVWDEQHVARYTANEAMTERQLLGR